MGPGSVGVSAGVALGRPPAPRGGAAASPRAPRGSPASTATSAAATAPSAATPAAAPGLLGLGDDVVEAHVDLVRHLKTE